MLYNIKNIIIFLFFCRRMMVKFTETEKLLKLVNDKVTNNFDLFKQEASNSKKIKELNSINNELNEKVQYLELHCKKA